MAEDHETKDERERLGDILVRAGVIDELQLRSALAEQKNWGNRIGLTLVKMGFLSERDLVQGLAQQLDMPLARLEGKRIEADVLALVPAKYAEANHCIPLFVKIDDEGRILYLGTDDPSNLGMLDDLDFRTGMRVRPVIVSTTELLEAIDRYYYGKTTACNDEGHATAGATHRPALDESSLEAPLADSDVDSVADANADAEPLEIVHDREPASEGPPRASADHVLRALCEILIEKGALSRQELASRIRGVLEASGRH